MSIEDIEILYRRVAKGEIPDNIRTLCNTNKEIMVVFYKALEQYDA